MNPDSAQHDSDPHERRADLHLHSSYSYDVPDLPELSPRALYDKAVALGMDFFTLTDHDTMKGLRALRRDLEAAYGERPPIPVIPGVELKVRDPRIGHTIHVNVLGLDAAQLRELGRRRRSMQSFLAYCRGQDLYHAYNHPFWFERRESPRLEAVIELMQAFPLVELNAGRIPEVNARTARLARRYRRHLVASSDSHTGQVGKAFTLAPGDSPEEFLYNIRLGRSRTSPSHLVYRGFMTEILQMIDLVFADRPARFKRTLLKQAPLARALGQALIGARHSLQSRLFDGTLRLVMRGLAHVAAGAYILSQRRMDRRVARAEAAAPPLPAGAAGEPIYAESGAKVARVA